MNIQLTDNHTIKISGDGIPSVETRSVEAILLYEILKAINSLAITVIEMRNIMVKK